VGKARLVNYTNHVTLVGVGGWKGGKGFHCSDCGRPPRIPKFEVGPNGAWSVDSSPVSPTRPSKRECLNKNQIV
jgi:hypothetical protein